VIFPNGNITLWAGCGFPIAEERSGCMIAMPKMHYIEQVVSLRVVYSCASKAGDISDIANSRAF
jgi:hypothetical protein